MLKKNKLATDNKPSDRFGFGRGSAKDMSGTHMPFSAYIDSHTIITNNGELMQTISIACDNHGANFDGAMRSAVQKAIVASGIDGMEQYAFWLHTIRDAVSSSTSTIQDEKLSFGSIVKDAWKSAIKVFGSFDTITYITIVKSGKDLRFRPSNLTLHLNKHMLYKWHDAHVAQGIEKLHQCTDAIMAHLSPWRVKKLGMTLKDDIYYSDHLAFWSRFTNFSVEQYRMPIVNLSKVLNVKTYSFYFDFGVVRDPINGSKRYFSIFSIKDCHALHRDAFAQLVNNMSAIKFCEVVHFDQRNEAMDAYKKQNEYLQISDDKDLRAALDLDKFFDTTKKQQTYRRVIMIMLDAPDKKSLDLNVADLVEKMSQIGLVMAVEDVGLARSFYAFMPGNFHYIKHSDFVDIEDIGSFVYSHSFGYGDSNKFRDNKHLCILPTVRQNPYPIGILNAKSDILVVDETFSFRPRAMWVNFLLSMLPSNARISIIEPSSFSRNFVEFSGGKNYLLSLQKSYNTCHFNPMSGIGMWPEYSTFLSDMLHLFTQVGLLSLGDEGNAFIAQVIAHVLDSKESYTDFGSFAKEFEGTPLEDTLMYWHGNGTRAHVLDSREESIFQSRDDNPIAITLNHDVMDNRLLTTTLVYTLLYTIISTAAKDRLNIVVLHDIFLLFPEKYQHFLLFLMRISRSYNTVFIATTSAHDVMLNWPRTLPDIVVNFDTKCHMSSFNVTDQYCEMFALTAGERYALERLPRCSIIKPSMLLKQDGTAAAVVPDFSSFHSDITGALCNDDIVSQQTQSMIAYGDDKWLEKTLNAISNQHKSS